MKKKYFSKLFILFIFLHCNTTIKTHVQTAMGKLCIYPERKNGDFPESQNYFHFVNLRSGDILIQFDKKEKDCYYFSKLPVGKVFHLDSVENVNISGYRYKWKTNGKLTRGIYGKNLNGSSEKKEIKTGMNDFGNYKLLVEYSEKEIESKEEIDVSGGRNSTSEVIVNAYSEIVKLK